MAIVLSYLYLKSNYIYAQFSKSSAYSAWHTNPIITICRLEHKPYTYVIMSFREIYSNIHTGWLNLPCLQKLFWKRYQNICASGAVHLSTSWLHIWTQKHLIVCLLSSVLSFCIQNQTNLCLSTNLKLHNLLLSYFCCSELGLVICNWILAVRFHSF